MCSARKHATAIRSEQFSTSRIGFGRSRRPVENGGSHESLPLYLGQRKCIPLWGRFVSRTTQTLRRGEHLLWPTCT
jgi:hypothetical protein